MSWYFQLLIGSIAVVVFVWLCLPERGSPTRGSDGLARLLDPNDSRQIGQLLGMMGGSIADAAVARFAIQRFQEIHGRPATTFDMAVVAGMMRSGGFGLDSSEDSSPDA